MCDIVKLFCIKCMYRITRIKKRLSLSWLLFVINIILISMLIIPNFFGKFPLYINENFSVNLPYKIDMYGKVYCDKNMDKINLKICAGGYSQKISEGEYEFSFLSESKYDNLICIIDDESNILWHSLIDFSDLKSEINIIINEENKNDLYRHSSCNR